jgi:hypothetical protein
MDFWFWWYYNRGGQALNFGDPNGNLGTLWHRINSNGAIGEGRPKLIDQIMTEVYSEIERAENGESGIVTNEFKQPISFTRGVVSTLVGGAVEVLGGSATGNPPLDLLRHTSLYALGDSNLFGMPHISWAKGAFEVSGNGTALDCTRGYWVDICGRIDIELRDAFEDVPDVPDVLDQRPGNQEIPGGQGYSITVRLSPVIISERVWISVPPGRN